MANPRTYMAGPKWLKNHESAFYFAKKNSEQFFVVDADDQNEEADIGGQPAIPPYEVYLWRTVGATMAAIADPNFAHVFGKKYDASDESNDEKAERKRILALLALSKSNTFGNFYIYWTMLTVAMKAHFSIMAHLTRFKSKHADILHCLPGVLPLVVDMISLLSSAESTEDIRQPLQDVYRQACEEVGSGPNYDDNDTLKKWKIVSSFILSEGSRHLSESMLKELQNALAEYETELSAWRRVEKLFANYQLAEAAINLTEPVCEEMMTAIEEFFTKHPVLFFAQNNEYFATLDNHPLLPITIANSKLAQTNPIAQHVQADQAELSKRVLHHLPWELAFVPHFRPFQSMWSEVSINLSVMNSYIKLTDQLRLVETCSDGMPNHVSIGLHVYGRFVLEDLVHTHDRRLGPHFYFQTSRYFDWLLETMAETKIVHWDPEVAKAWVQTQFIDLYHKTVAKYTDIFFINLMELLRLSSKHPYPCEQSLRLLNTVDALYKSPDKHEQILDEFYQCVLPVANKLVKYVGCMLEKQKTELEYVAVMQQIEGAKQQLHDDNYLVANRLMTPDGQVMLEGRFGYDQMMAEINRERESIGMDLPSMVAVLDGRLPEMVKSLDLIGKFDLVMSRIRAIQEAYMRAVDTAPELSEEDCAFLELELKFGDLFRRVVVACTRARQYRRMTYIEELVPLIVVVNQGGGVDMDLAQRLLPVVTEKLSGARKNIDEASPDQQKRMLCGVLRILNLFMEIQQGFMQMESGGKDAKSLNEEIMKDATTSAMANNIETSLRKIQDMTAGWTKNNPLNLSDDEESDAAFAAEEQ